MFAQVVFVEGTWSQMVHLSWATKGGLRLMTLQLDMCKFPLTDLTSEGQEQPTLEHPGVTTSWACILKKHAA